MVRLLDAVSYLYICHQYKNKYNKYFSHIIKTIKIIYYVINATLVVHNSHSVLCYKTRTKLTAETLRWVRF